MPKNAAVETDLTVYANKVPTTMQARFADWLLEETTYDPASAKTKEQAFRMGVALGAFLRPTYQASDANQAARAESRAAETSVAKPVKLQGRKAKATETPAPTPAPAKAKATKGGPRKAAARPASEASDSPF
jgi:hypothetical protein